MKFTHIAQLFELSLTHDRSQLHVVSGLRNAIGVFMALCFGVFSGHTAAGLGIAIGAQVSGFAGLNGTILKRLQTMVLAALWMTVTTFLSGLIGGTWIGILVICVLGFFTGFLSCVSNEAGLIGMWATIAYILFSWFPHPGPAGALYRGIFVLCGGFLQATLMLGLEWIHDSRIETKSVAKVYRSIGEYAKFASREADLLVAQSLQTAATQIRDSMLHERYKEVLESLLDVAESIRIEIVALHGQRSVAEGCLSCGPLGDVPESVSWVRGVANLLDRMARILDSGSASHIEIFAQHLHSFMSESRANGLFEHMVFEQTEGQDVQVVANGVERMVHDMETALELLRALFDLRKPRRRRWSFTPTFQVKSGFNVMRANLTFKSVTFRHGIRLAAALATATIVYPMLPFPRGYWLPLTVLVILRPEFKTTFSRGIARVVGTLMGVLLATFILFIPDTRHLFGAVLVSVLLWGMYTVLNYNLVLFSGILTAEIVVLLSFFADVHAKATIDDRVVYTLLGSALAFVAYLAWPTWLHRTAADSLANLAAAEQNYVEAVFSTIPGNVAERETYRKLTRLARTNAFNAIQQATEEPNHLNFDKDAANGVLTALNRLSESLLALESYLSKNFANESIEPEVVRFGGYVKQCLAEAEWKMRHSNPFVAGSTEEGALDVVSPYTKHELTSMKLPIHVRSVLLRIEDILGTLFRMLPE